MGGRALVNMTCYDRRLLFLLKRTAAVLVSSIFTDNINVATSAKVSSTDMNVTRVLTDGTDE